MARAINFVGPDFEFNAEIEKFDRKKVYGYTKLEVRDEANSICSLATLSDNGSDILPSLATGIALLNNNGQNVERSSLKAIDIDGNEIMALPSAFDKPVFLIENTIQDYLDLNVKSIYQLTILEDDIKEKLLTVLENNVFSFSFNYRAGFDADDAFLIAADNAIFAVIGNKCEFNYLGLNISVFADEIDDADDELDDLDFGML